MSFERHSSSSTGTVAIGHEAGWSAAPATVRRGRVAWLDAARGMAIMLVVLGHALHGLFESGLLPRASPLNDVNFALSTFRMQLFWLMAGLFVADTIRRGPGPFASATLVRVAWPYLLWNSVMLVMLALAGSRVNTQVDLTPYRFVELLWQPSGQYWFLYSLLIFRSLTLLFARAGGFGAMFACALVARVAAEAVPLPLVLHQSALYWLYFAFAVWASDAIRAIDPPARALPAALAGLALLWALAVFAVRKGEDPHAVWALPAGILGTAFFLLLPRLRALPLRDLFARVGRRSMAIYLLHVLFVAGTRIACVNLLHIRDPYAILAVAVPLGVVGPIVVHRAAARLGLVRALGL